MGSYTQLEAADVAGIATAFGVGEVRDWRAIPGGCVNSNFELRASGGHWFLRVNEGKTEAEVRYESELVTELARAGVPAPAPLCALDDRPFVRHADRFVSLFPWVEGAHREPAGVSASDAAAVGSALAQLHRAGAPLVGRFPRDGIYTFADIADRFEGFRQHSDPGLALAIAAISDEIEWLAARAEVRARAPRGLIHADLFCDNVFFAKEKLIALIDFEQACVGSIAYDLAVCIDAWCYARDFSPRLIAAMLAGYQGEGELAEPAREALYVETRAAALRFTVTRITDAYLRPTGIPGKDFRRFLARLLRLREVGADGFRAWAADRAP